MVYVPSFTLSRPVFQKAMRTIAAITVNTEITTITTDIAHQYLPKLIVRIDIPVGFGMPQMNQMVGTILTVPTATTFTIDISTIGFDTFAIPTIPAGRAYQCPQVVPVGETNDILTQATQNVLPYTS